MNPLRLGVLGSGKGTNRRAILERIQAGELQARAAVVISDVFDAPILDIAREFGVLNAFLPPGHFKTRLEPQTEMDLVRMLREAEVDLVVLAGFMRVLKAPMLAAWTWRGPYVGGTIGYGAGKSNTDTAFSDPVSGAELANRAYQQAIRLKAEFLSGRAASLRSERGYHFICVGDGHEISTQTCLTALRRMHELVLADSQFIIATHSPIILAYPNATIYSCQAAGVERIAYEDAEPVRLTQSFLEARERFLHELFSD